MKTALYAALAVGAALGPSAPALASARLAEQKQCMQCHAADRRVIGPSFKTIKATYKQMKNPQAHLVEVIKHGSDAHLGPMTGQARMPGGSERPPISDREAKQLARWILS